LTQTIADERYTADFAALEEQRKDEPAWLRELRRRGIDTFNQLGFPTARKGNEPYKYTDIRPIAGASVEHPVTPGDVSGARIEALLPFDEGLCRIVIVDGHYAPALSRFPGDSLTVAPLSEAIAGDIEAVRNLQAGGEAFSALNTALFRDGVLIHSTGVSDDVVHVLYVTSEHSRPVVTYPRTLVVAGRLSEITLAETHISLGETNHFTNAVTEIIIEEGATVRYNRLMLENQQSYHVATVRVDQKRDSVFEAVSYSAGGGLARINLDVGLVEPGSSATINGLYITSGDQHIDNMINIDHAAPHTTSRLFYKGILDDRSKAVFGGTVFVRKGADKTDAHQEDKNLLLSHEAEVDSKPALEIYADDVKAGHGATAGAIADEALFYMRSRGLDEDTAMQFLVRGFAAEIIEKISIEPLREWLEGQALAALPRFRRDEAEA
jgi:Fe-S cluster assembly protein SufD